MGSLISSKNGKKPVTNNSKKNEVKNPFKKPDTKTKNKTVTRQDAIKSLKNKKIRNIAIGVTVGILVLLGIILGSMAAAGFFAGATLSPEERMCERMRDEVTNFCWTENRECVNLNVWDTFYNPQSPPPYPTVSLPDEDSAEDLELRAILGDYYASRLAPGYIANPVTPDNLVFEFVQKWFSFQSEPEDNLAVIQQYQDRIIISIISIAGNQNIQLAEPTTTQATGELFDGTEEIIISWSYMTYVNTFKTRTDFADTPFDGTCSTTVPYDVWTSPGPTPDMELLNSNNYCASFATFQFGDGNERNLCNSGVIACLNPFWSESNITVVPVPNDLLEEFAEFIFGSFSGVVVFNQNVEQTKVEEFVGGLYRAYGDRTLLNIWLLFDPSEERYNVIFGILEKDSLIELVSNPDPIPPEFFIRFYGDAAYIYAQNFNKETICN